MITIREARETDAISIGEIFLATYGTEYAYPVYYDELGLKKLIFSENTVMLVAEDEETGRVVGTASVMLEAGAFTDLVGEFGAITFSGDKRIETGIFKVDALKPTGAGDAFMGTFLASLAQGRELQDSVLRGSASAAIVVSKVACAPAMPTPSQLEEFLQNHPGPAMPAMASA